MKSALVVALLSLATLSLPAQANTEGLETGALVICDTQKQIERLGELFEGKADAAISAVNVEASDPTACGMADVAYVAGKPLGTVRSKSHAFHVVPIIVVAVNTPRGQQPVNSTVYFTLVKVQEFSV